MMLWLLTLLACQADVALASANPTARQEAATWLGTQADAHTIGLLWTLSYDRDPDVRQAALDAVIARCARETPFVCTTMLGYFRADRAQDIAWSARNALLLHDADAALLGAEVDYRQDLLQRLAAPAWPMPVPQARQILRRLVHDADVGVQEQAAYLLERQP